MSGEFVIPVIRLLIGVARTKTEMYKRKMSRKTTPTTTPDFRSGSMEV